MFGFGVVEEDAADDLQSAARLMHRSVNMSITSKESPGITATMKLILDRVQSNPRQLAIIITSRDTSFNCLDFGTASEKCNPILLLFDKVAL